MCLAIIPATVLATDGGTDAGGIPKGNVNIYSEDIADYILYVGGTKVTNENAADILGDGCAKFDAATSTLTLTDASIANNEGHGIYAENMDLIIHGIDTVASGSNTISSKDIVEVMTEEETVIYPCAAIYSENGTVKLTGIIGDIKAESTGIYAANGITIEGTLGDILCKDSGLTEWGTSNDGLFVSFGSITISGTVGNITTDGTGINANEGDILISGNIGNIIGENGIAVFGGNINILGIVGNISPASKFNLGGTAIASNALPEYDDSLNYTGYIGGNINICGKIGNVAGGSCGIWADGNITISKTKVSVSTVDEYDAYAIVTLGEILTEGIIIVEPVDYTWNSIDYGEGVEYKYIADNEGNAVLKVVFATDINECNGVDGCPSTGFSDIDTKEWYHKAADYVLTKGLMNGVGDNLFDVNGTTNRAMIVTMLWRLDDELECETDITEVFADVPANEWYTKAVTWAYVNGIVDGLGDNLYGPLNPVTREQLATILYRYASYKESKVGSDVDTNPPADIITNVNAKPATNLDPTPNTNINATTSATSNLSSFIDADSISNWALDAMNWAIGEKIISGKGNNDLVPGGYASRVETAQMFMNFLTK